MAVEHAFYQTANELVTQNRIRTFLAGVYPYMLAYSKFRYGLIHNA